MQQVRHAIGIVFVHLTTMGLDEEFSGHGISSIEGAGV